MNAWELKFVASIKKQIASGKTLSQKQQACIAKIVANHGPVLEGNVEEEELTWKQRYGKCEDAPCCGCCGQHPYYG